MFTRIHSYISYLYGCHIYIYEYIAITLIDTHYAIYCFQSNKLAVIVTLTDYMPQNRFSLVFYFSYTHPLSLALARFPFTVSQQHHIHFIFSYMHQYQCSKIMLSATVQFSPYGHTVAICLHQHFETVSIQAVVHIRTLFLFINAVALPCIRNVTECHLLNKNQNFNNIYSYEAVLLRDCNIRRENF